MLPSLGYTRLNTVKKFVKISSCAWWHTHARATWNSAQAKKKKDGGTGGDSRETKVLKAFRRAKNLKDLRLRNSLPGNLPHQSPGTFPCNRTVRRTCPNVNSSSTITTPKGMFYITGHFSCITEQVVHCLSYTKCPSIVSIWETGCRLADRFREHRRDIINGRNDLPVPAHFNQPNHTLEDMKVAVLKAGLANQEYRKKQEMRLIFKYGTVSPRGLNQDFSFTWMTPASPPFFCLLERCSALFHVARARVCHQARELILTNFLTVFSLVYPEEGNIAETSVTILV